MEGKYFVRCRGLYADPEPPQISEAEWFLIIVKGFRLLSIVKKLSILNACESRVYTFNAFAPNAPFLYPMKISENLIF